MNTGMKFLWIAAVAFLAACTTGNNTGVTAYDLNSDNRLDRAEFNTAYDDLGYYTRWDADRDMRLTETEWNTGIGSSYPDYDNTRYGTYMDWDLNNDGFIDQDEFYDSNYRMWDTNRDGFIEVSEYDSFYY